MTRPTLAHLLGVAFVLGTAPAWAQECPKPGVRQLGPIATAIGQDEVLAAGFEAAAAACGAESMACDEEKVRCGTLLTTTLQQQLTFDEGAYLRDMLVAYLGQQYRMQVPIAAPTTLTDVSCNTDAVTLRAAANRRKQQAERRKVVMAEYPRWIVWVNNQFKSCQDRVAVEKARVDAAAAESAKLLAAAEAAKQAELAKQDQKAAAERAAKEKAEQEAKAKKAALEAQQDAAAEAARKKADAEEAARRAKETAAEKAAREAKEAADAKLVADREAKKAQAEKARQDLIDKEAMRATEVKERAETARRTAEAAHQKKVEELKRSLELSEADKAARLAEVDKEYEAAEAKRREVAQKEIDAAGKIDRSDERLGGGISIHASGGYFSLATDAKPVLGGQLTLRHGFWGTAPASGLASGLELRATALFLTAVDVKTYLLQVSPEIRYWLGLFGIGVTFDFQYIQTASSGPLTAAGAVDVGKPSSTLGLGPTISIAAADSPAGRLFFTVRWTPFLNEQWERVTGEIEGGYELFSFAVQGGVVKQNRSEPPGFFVGGSLGVRLRW